MSEVRKVTSVRRLKNGKEVTIMMQSNVGDPYQEYRGEGASGATAAPDWTVDANRPTIWAEIYSNLQRIIYTDAQWTYNVTKLTFGSDGLSTNSGLEGVFLKTTYQGVPALKIMKNLASKDNQDNDIIYLDCAFKVAGIDDRAQSSITVGIGRASADVYKGTIQPVNDGGYVIKKVNSSIQVRGGLLFGGAKVNDADYTVEWKKQLNGSLVPLTDDTGSNVSDTSNHTITITNSMVNSALNLYAIFKDKNGKELTSDVQGIIDASDPLSIKLNAVPADEVIVNDDDTVVYTPNVVNSDGQVMTEFSNKFLFLLSNEQGEKITGAYDNSTVPTSSQTITAADVDKAEPGALIVEIIADDTL